MEKQWKQWLTIFLGSKITADGDCSHEIKRRLLHGRKSMTNLDSVLKSIHITLPTKVCIVNAMVFPVVMYGCESHVRMWELDNKEGRVPKNWCFCTVVLEKTLESPLDCKETEPVHPKRRSVLSVHGNDLCWSWNSNTLDTWCKELIPWIILWC